VTDGEEDRNGAAHFVRELFGIPENLEVLCAIALGYPDEERKDYDPAKLKYEKIHNE
jgi:nitroreductase